MRRWMLVVAGCGGIEAEVDYAEARADAECRQLERCAQGYFEATYPSQKDCVHDLQEQLSTADDLLQQASCDYVAEEAGRCVRRIHAMSCEDYVEGDEGRACDLVWDCGAQVYSYTTYGGF